MSARVPLCLLVAVCLVPTTMLAQRTGYQEHSSYYLKIIELKEEVQENGNVYFVGVVKNAHPDQDTDGAQVYVAIKKDGAVIGFTGSPRSGCSDRLPAGDTCSFVIKTKYKQGDYDSFAAQIQKAYFYPPNKLDPWALKGEFYVVESSINMIPNEHREDSILILGDLYNGTNAILTIDKLDFGLWDATGEFLGIASGGYGYGGNHYDISPGQTLSFAVWNENIPFADVASCKPDLEYTIERYIDDIATTVDGASWGQIKAMGR